MKLNEKVILVDCDGVLLDWMYSFDAWMTKRGYKMIADDQYDIEVAYGIDKSKAKELIHHFNESAAIGFLTPFRDAIKYVKKLHEEHGYVFHCITSLSENDYAYNLRWFNLATLFGEGVFEQLICLDTGADKTAALTKYKDSGCFWVEDKPENAVIGHELGLCSVLMMHGHNSEFTHPDIPEVKSWKEIYEMIVTWQ